MAKIRVKCPACKTELEVDSEFAGKEVECGNCLEVFVANPPGSGSQRGEPGTSGSSGGSRAGSSGSRRGRSRDGEEERPRRRSRSRRDEDDDYEHDRRRRDDEDDEDYYSPPPPRRGGGGSGLGIASLILGITAFVPGCCCWTFVGVPLALAAIVTGSIGMKNPEGKGMAVAGVVLGGVWFILIAVLFIIGFGANLANPGRFR
jgi:predicted Zn finger-like uncharacterized protein